MTDKVLIDRETVVQSLETLQRSPWKNWRVDRSIDSLTAALANAQLTEISETKPIGYIDEMDKPRLTKDKRLISLSVSGGCEPLYPSPMPTQDVEDAARYRWLRDYLISPSTHFDDLIVSADKAETLNGVIDAARAKGAKQ